MLERLYLENNKISYIDRDAFTNMTKLIELKLTNNLLNTFPIIIGCTKLARLYLSHNRINQLYNNFQSVNLEQLEVSFPYLEFGLESLKYLERFWIKKTKKIVFKYKI